MKSEKIHIYIYIRIFIYVHIHTTLMNKVWNHLLFEESAFRFKSPPSIPLHEKPNVTSAVYGASQGHLGIWRFAYTVNSVTRVARMKMGVSEPCILKFFHD